MVVRIKKKRRRGERTYHGMHKKWRGGGSRGGRGKAGLHKHKWSYVVKYEPEHFGKKGFKVPLAVRKKVKVINLGDLEKIFEKLAEKEGEKIKINVLKFGYEKVLGKGRIKKPLIVEARYFSKQALKKLEKIGGKAIVIK